MKDIIEYADFAKLDIRAGIVVSCEKVENAEKLYRLMVNVGEENPRQIVSSLVDYYTAEELVGKHILVLVNLKPAKMCGVLSEGMLLCCESEDSSTCVLLTSETPVEPGTPVT